MEFKGIISKVVERSGTSQSTGKEWKRTGFVFEFKEHDTDPWFDKVYLEPRMNSFEVLRKKEAEPQPTQPIEQPEAIQPTPEGDDLTF